MTDALIALVELALLAVAAIIGVEIYNEVWRAWQRRKAQRQREREWREATKHYGRH